MKTDHKISFPKGRWENKDGWDASEQALQFMKEYRKRWMEKDNIMQMKSDYKFLFQEQKKNGWKDKVWMER